MLLGKNSQSRKTVHRKAKCASPSKRAPELLRFKPLPLEHAHQLSTSFFLGVFQYAVQGRSVSLASCRSPHRQALSTTSLLCLVMRAVLSCHNRLLQIMAPWRKSFRVSCDFFNPPPCGHDSTSVLSKNGLGHDKSGTLLLCPNKHCMLVGRATLQASKKTRCCGHSVLAAAMTVCRSCTAWVQRSSRGAYGHS